MLPEKTAIGNSVILGMSYFWVKHTLGYSVLTGFTVREYILQMPLWPRKRPDPASSTYRP